MFNAYFTKYFEENEDAQFYVRKDHNDQDEIFLIKRDCLIKASVYKDATLEVEVTNSKIDKLFFIESPTETILEIIFENGKTLNLSSIIDSHGRHREEYALAIKELSYKLM